MDDPPHLWLAFHHHPDEKERSQARADLIVHYSGLVRYVAWRASARLHSSIERDDIVSYGLFGLIDAIKSYRPETGVPFKNYAIPRIHGSIIDELRTLDWVPRSMRAKERTLVKATEKLEQQLGRPPDEHELAVHLGWTGREVSGVQAQVDSRQMRYYLETAKLGDGDGEDRLDAADLSLEDPDLNLELETTRMLLAMAIGRLPDRERAVAAMYWRGGVCPACEGWGNECGRCEGYGTVASLTLGEIGAVLGISESSACQLYTNAATLLRNDLARLH